MVSISVKDLVIFAVMMLVIGWGAGWATNRNRPER